MYKGERVVGIIAEFNPFHEGHRYLIRYAKEKYQAKYVVVAMSGDFVQRGEPGFFSKYERTEKALRNGVDLVLQMPVLFSTASAEDFAACGVAMLEKAGIVDLLLFGSESGRIEPLEEAAAFLLREERGAAARSAFSRALRMRLREGQSFPAAREAAAREVEPGLSLSLCANDVLGVEYLKAMKRQNVGFSAAVLRRNQKLRSAHSIREGISESCGADCVHRCYAEADMLSDMLSYRLLEMERDGISCMDFSDVSEELARGLRKQLFMRKTFRERAALLKSKNVTYSRVSRALLHILLDIRKDMVQRAREEGYVSFHRVLGVSRDGRALLGALQLPVLSSPARWEREAEGAGELQLRTDLFASRIYGMIYNTFYNDYTEKLRVL